MGACDEREVWFDRHVLLLNTQQVVHKRSPLSQAAEQLAAVGRGKQFLSIFGLTEHYIL